MLFPVPPVSPPSSSAAAPLPDFLVIGAMKAGTTTLYHDLRSQPGVFLPDKESNALLADDPGAACARLFGPAASTGGGTDVLRGEVCPDYTKPGPEERALAAAAALYGDRSAPKLVYLVREPIARLRSHHHFVSTQHGAANPGGMTTDLAASLRDFPELVETSRYATRLRPWVERFGIGSVRVIRFEDYIADRVGTLRELTAWLGLPDFDSAAIRTDTVFNPGDTRPVATPFWRKVMENPLYRRFVRPWLSLEWRDRIRGRLLPKPPPRSGPPSESTRRELVAILRPEVDALAGMIGAAPPFWNLAAEAEPPEEAK